LAETSVVREAPLLIAVDAEERANGQILVRLASEVDPLWLLDLYPERLTETDARVWNAQTQKVERLTRMAYGAISLEETRAPAEPGPETSRVLAAEALSAGLERFVDPEVLAGWLARVETLAQAYPEAGLPAPDDAFLRSTLERACEGLRGFAELREVSLISLLEAQLSPAQQRLLSGKTPERVTLPGGRGAKVRYARGQAPWIESRLQDFFGLAQGPTVCDGRVALVLHLLAPNHRAVQVTTDLAGFWERHYPAIRKELMRRYPRHAWPEDPRHATPPAPRR
jgi:ATP-dependent helicase HrpB